VIALRRFAVTLAAALALTACASGVETFQTDDILVEQTLRGIDRPDDSVEVAITALRVEGQVLRLELAITPLFATTSDDLELALEDLEPRYFDQPVLVDRANLQRYEVVSRDGSDPYRSPRATKTDNGETMRAYYYYAAPQEGVDVLDVVLSDAYPAFTDVPVGR